MCMRNLDPLSTLVIKEKRSKNGVLQVGLYADDVWVMWLIEADRIILIEMGVPYI